MMYESDMIMQRFFLEDDDHVCCGVETKLHVKLFSLLHKVLKRSSYSVFNPLWLKLGVIKQSI